MQSRLLPRNSELPTLAKSPRRFVRRYWLPLAMLCAGCVIDAITTYQNTRDYTSDVEVHPVQRIMFEVLGPAVGVPAAKVAQFVFVVFVAAWWRPWCGWLMALCGAAYFLAGLSNHYLWL